MCPSELCDIFRCSHHLPLNASEYSGLDAATVASAALYHLLYPDLGVGSGPPRPPPGRAVAPAPPRTMLDLLNLQAAEREAYDSLRKEDNGPAEVEPDQQLSFDDVSA